MSQRSILGLLRCFAIFISVGLLTGCENTLPATVSGTITVDGESLSGVKGEVMFHPSGGGAMAMASLGKDGTYSINTGTTKGLDPGSYLVTVRVVRNEPAASGGNQGAPKQTPLASSKYGDRDKSGLTAEVKPGNNVFDFDLKSK